MRAVAWVFSVVTALSLVTSAAAGDSGDISVERGLRVSIVGGCHDCHTEGYIESEGRIDPDKALKRSKVGWRGPWGTTYPLNLRLTANGLTEDDYVLWLKSLKTSPPMPWFNVRAMEENDMRSLYRYIRSLGDTGELAPNSVGPGVEPTTPFVVISPPQAPAPAGCKSDLKCAPK